MKTHICDKEHLEINFCLKIAEKPRAITVSMIVRIFLYKLVIHIYADRFAMQEN